MSVVNEAPSAIKTFVVFLGFHLVYLVVPAGFIFIPLYLLRDASTRAIGTAWIVGYLAWATATRKSERYSPELSSQMISTLIVYRANTILLLPTLGNLEDRGLGLKIWPFGLGSFRTSHSQSSAHNRWLGSRHCAH
jgi:hypothetical protein